MPRSRDLVAALWITLIPAISTAQNTEPQSPAQKKPAKPGAQAGQSPADVAASDAAPTDRAASAASAAQAEKKPAKRGAQAGPTPEGASTPR